MSHVAVAPETCPNCARAVEGAYCAGCGQKAGPIDPTLHDFVHDFIHELLHVDGKIFGSVRLLLTRPGFLTREYVEGRRARYISPIRLYLIFSVAYFGLAAIAPPAKQGSGIRVELSDADDAELRQLGFESEEQLQQEVRAATGTWAPRAMFVLVPLFALLVKGATRRSGRNYPQHLYFALHLHAGAFAILAVGVLGRLARPVPYVEETIGIAAMVLLFVYSVVSFQRAYGGTTARAVVRTAVVGIPYVITIGVAVGLMIAPLILRVYSAVKDSSAPSS
jgi:hypothetical protein